MARSPHFDTELLLDAAVWIVARSGPSGVTVSAVEEAVQAPSGAVANRFPGRNTLLAEVWLRTVERFQEGYLQAAASEPLARPTAARRPAGAAARHVVGWSRAHPQEAALLLHGPRAFGHADWSQEHRRRADRDNQRIHAALASVATTLWTVTRFPTLNVAQWARGTPAPRSSWPWGW